MFEGKSRADVHVVWKQPRLIDQSLNSAKSISSMIWYETLPFPEAITH